MKNLILACVAAVVLTMSACGGGAPLAPGGSGTAGAAGTSGGAGAGGAAGACTNTPSCGGEVVGTWTVSASCIGSGTTSAGIDDCPAATGRTIGYKIGGTFAFAADLTYVATTTLVGTVILDYPTSCLTASGTTCVALSSNLMTAIGGMFSSASCATMAPNCHCTFVLSGTPKTETGTYSTSGGVLSELTDGETSADESTYCVKGNTLTLSPSMMDPDTVGTITLTKP